jgi:hypothetical protein
MSEVNQTPRMYGASEVAEALGVHVQNLGFISGLPSPVQKVRATRLWRADEIDVFAIEYAARRAARQARSSEAAEGAAA